MQTPVDSKPDAVAAPSFAAMGLDPSVIQAIADRGYDNPTPIQEEAIPLILNGRDVIGASQTGTGKTAAFALPILTRLKDHGALRCLILEPVRELAQQVIDFLQSYGRGLNLRMSLLHGGVGYGRQLEELRAGPDIVVATPGRLLDHMGQGAVSLNKVDILVLDEADRMLDMGFIPDVRRIIGQCRKKRQSMLFSATIGPEIARIISWACKNPVQIAIGGGSSPAETVNHAIYPVDDRQKFDLLLALLEQIEFHSVIIFTRTKVGADIFARWLEAAGHPAVILHSNRSQRERDQALREFKSGKVEILVATDIVARGIDIRTVSHVINYDIPQHPGDYVHRIGRTGRMNNEGDAVTLYTAADKEFLRSIEQFIGREIEHKRLEGFDYNWSPVLEDEKTLPKRRNRGYSTASTINFRSKRRRR